jgi:xanthine dehydrogenase accessory factor
MSPANARSHSTQIAERITHILDEGSTAAVVTLISAATNVGAKLLVEENGERCGSLGAQDLDGAVVQRAGAFLHSRGDMAAMGVKEFAPELSEFADAQLLFERIQREPRLVICGAGHVGAALANLASLLGYQSTLIDDRAEFVTRERFPDERIDLVAAEDWFDAVRNAVSDGRGVAVAVVTRGHSEDEACMRAVMVSGADYVGLIGSKRRTRIVLERIRGARADEARLENVRAPIGLDIGAVTPEEVALAIMAEIIAERRGGKGGSLSAKGVGKRERATGRGER